MNASEVNEMAEYIIKLVQTLLQTTKKVKVLYGGSVNEDNASEFLMPLA